MRWILLPLILICSLPALASAGQIVAGSPEDKMLQRITAETDPEAKLSVLMEFEKQFPQSNLLPQAYLMVIDLYRQKNDRAKIIEYGEKVLRVDEGNVTAMMILSRNYAIERTNLDRAVSLAQEAIDRIVGMKAGAAPATQTSAEWENYLQSSEASARSILDYAKSMRDQ